MDHMLNSIEEWLPKVFTLDTLTFVLATIGSLGTAISVIKSARKLKATLIYFGYNKENNLAGAYIQFDNYSRMSISITDLHLHINDVDYPCQKLPTRFSTHEHKIGAEVVSSHDYYNLPFPVQLAPLGGASGYFVFELPQGISPLPSTPQTFQVSANRGRAMKMKLKPHREYFR